MSAEGSITVLLKSLQEREDTGAQQVYERYIHRLVSVARAKLSGTPRRVADEEDVAQEAFDGFFRGVRQGRFPKLNDRHDLWYILVMITERRVVDQHKWLTAQKRGREVGESALNVSASSSSDSRGINQVADYEPTPEMAAEFAEQFRLRLAQLAESKFRLQEIAQWKMEGYTNQELADRIGRVVKTVERRLKDIREIWEEAG